MHYLLYLYLLCFRLQRLQKNNHLFYKFLYRILQTLLLTYLHL